MKKLQTLGLLITFMLIGSAAFAQLEISLTTGYHMGAFKTADMNNVTQDVKANGDFTIENNYVSLGGGIPINLGIGIPVSDALTFNLDLGMWLGSNTTISELNQVTNIGGGNTLTQAMTTEGKTTQFRAMPGLTYKTESGLYGRAALVVPLGGKTVVTQDVKVTGPGTTQTANAEIEYKGRFSLGAAAAIGYNIPLGDALSLGIELQALALNIKGNTSEITKYETSGGASLSDLDKYDIETEYLDELDQNSNNDSYNPNYDTDKAKEDLAGITSFGAWGLNFRLVYTLGN